MVPIFNAALLGGFDYQRHHRDWGSFGRTVRLHHVHVDTSVGEQLAVSLFLLHFHRVEFVAAEISGAIVTHVGFQGVRFTHLGAQCFPRNHVRVSTLFDQSSLGLITQRRRHLGLFADISLMLLHILRVIDLARRYQWVFLVEVLTDSHAVRHTLHVHLFIELAHRHIVALGLRAQIGLACIMLGLAAPQRVTHAMYFICEQSGVCQVIAFLRG